MKSDIFHKGVYLMVEKNGFEQGTRKFMLTSLILLLLALSMSFSSDAFAYANSWAYKIE